MIYEGSTTFSPNYGKFGPQTATFCISSHPLQMWNPKTF